MLWNKLIFVVLGFHLIFTPCYHVFSATTNNYQPTNYFQSKKKIAIFPFINNTDIANLDESIPDLLHGELFRSGFFEIIEKKILNKTIWELDLSNNIKIDNTNKQSHSPNQAVDLYSKLNKKNTKKIATIVGAEYLIKGSINQFGVLLRIELNLLESGSNNILESLSAEVFRTEDIPEAVKALIPALKSVCIKDNIEEIANSIIGQYRSGLSTLKATISNLKEIAEMESDSIYASSLLLSLYVEEDMHDDIEEACITIISAVTNSVVNFMDVVSRLGVNPYEQLGSYYERDGLLDEATKVYRDATETAPFNKAYYYNKLGTVLLKQGKANEAIQAFQNSINLSPTEFEPHYQLAMAYEMQNNMTKALEEYKKSLKYTGGIIKGLPIEEIKKKIEDLK